MTLALRRTVFADGERRSDDYEVRHNGRTVGRILRLRSTGRELWQWTQITIRAPSYGPNGGVADTLDEAKAAFRGHWGKARDHTSGLEVATASSYSDASMLVQSIKKRASLC